MAVKTILTEPNKLLRQISKPVENVGKEEQQLMSCCSSFPTFSTGFEICLSNLFGSVSIVLTAIMNYFIIIFKLLKE